MTQINGRRRKHKGTHIEVDTVQLNKCFECGTHNPGNYRVGQKITCMGCGKKWPRAAWETPQRKKES